MLAACVFRLPQSPRYLVQRGDNEGALDVCRRLHYDPAHPESDLYLREHAQIVQQHAIDQHSPASWASMFRIAHYRKRAIIGHTTMFFVQCSGNLVITNYAPILYGKLGYDANKQLLMAGAWITMCPFGNLLNAFLLDKVGRRLLLSGGLMGCTLCLVAEAISVARFQQTGSQAASLAAVAFLFIHVSTSVLTVLRPCEADLKTDVLLLHYPRRVFLCLRFRDLPHPQSVALLAIESPCNER